MNQIRDVLATVEGIARQFPEAAQTASMVKQALVKLTMDVVGSARQPESPAPRVMA